MAKPPVMEPAKIEVNKMDIKIMLAATLCILTSILLKHFGLTVKVGSGENTRTLEIIQAMTSAISCLLCVQGGVTASAKAGWTRLKVTVAAAIVAFIVVLIDTAIGNEWVIIPLFMVGLVATIFLCKVFRAPYMNCRIGGVNFVLMALTLQQNARLVYTGFRILSTLYGVLMVLLVTWIFSLFEKKENPENKPA